MHGDVGLVLLDCMRKGDHHMKRSVIRSSLLTFFLMTILVACFIHQLNETEMGMPHPSPVETEEVADTDEHALEHEVEPPPPTQLTLAAVGDIMMHSTQIEAARKSDGSYDFRDVFQDIKPYLQEADLVFGNLETTFSGREPYTGYPLFNAPDAVADALAEAGLDLIQTANNHTMDTGAEGTVRTYNVLREKGLRPIGTAPSSDEQRPLIVERNDITCAFLAYTYGTNGIPIPEDKPYLVNLIDEATIEKDIREAKKAGAEWVVVGLHFGNEYEREPTDVQRQLVKRVFEMGADVILGSHPHVLQPMEQMEVNGKSKFVIYSLGNFVSNQFFNPYVNKGLVLYLDLEKNNEKETVTLKNVRFLPTVVHRYAQNGTKYTIVPIEEDYVVEGSLPYDYPGLTFPIIADAWEQTTAHMRKYESFPTFRLSDGADE